MSEKGDSFTHRNYDEDMILSVFYIAIALCIAAIYRELCKKIIIPYSTLVVYTAFVLDKYRDNFGMIGQAAWLFSVIHPYVSLLLYVPLAVFEPLFNADWYTLKRLMRGLLLLGGVGVIISTFFIAFFFQVILGFNNEISWFGALIIGSVLSCIDPTEVLPSMRGKGCPSSFVNLLESETRFNAGMSLLCFQIFNSLEKIDFYAPQVQDESIVSLTSIKNILLHIYYFVSGITLGGIMGLVFGMIFGSWLQRIIRDDVLSTFVSFSMVYLMHYICEYTFIKVSGISAMIVLGIFMSSIGKTKMYPQSESYIKSVWKFYGTCISVMALNTAGVKIANQISNQEMDWDHYKMVPFVWISMILARAVSITIMRPWLNNQQNINDKSITYKEIIVYALGGVKGGFCINMCMMIFVDPLMPQRHKQIMIFYIQSVVLVSQLVQIILARFVVSQLYSPKKSKIQIKLLKNAMIKYVKMIEGKEEQLRQQNQLWLAKWYVVRRLIGYQDILAKTQDICQKEEISQDDIQSIQNNSESKKESLCSRVSVLISNDQIKDIRYRFIVVIKGSIWKKYLNGEVGGDATQLIDSACSMELEEIDQAPIALWNKLHQQIQGIFQHTCIKKLFTYTYNQKLLVQHLTSSIEAVIQLIFCIEEAQSFKQELLIQKFSQMDIDYVIVELQNDHLKAEQYIAELNFQFQEMIQLVQTSIAAKSLLQRKAKFLNEKLQSGELTQIEYESMRQEIDRKLVNVSQQTIGSQFLWGTQQIHINQLVQDVPHHFWTILAQFPLFSLIEKEALCQLEFAFISKGIVKFKQGTNLYTRGSNIEYIYLLNEGIVEERIFETNYKMYKQVGSILSLVNLFNEEKKAFCNSLALTDISVLCLPCDVMNRILQSNNKFKVNALLQSLIYLIQMNIDKAGPLSKLSENQIFIWALQQEIIQSQKNSFNIQFEMGAYILQGKVQLNNKQQDCVYNQFTYIQPQTNNCTILPNTIVLKFKKELDINFSQIQESKQF